VRKERYEDESDHRDQRSDHGESIAIPLSNDAVEKQTKNLADPCSIRKAALPWSGYLVFPGLVLDSEFLVEGWEGEERGYEYGVCDG